MKKELIKDVKKIAVLRANALGDFIFALPALDALKKKYPKAELVYLGKVWHSNFLKGRPGPIDRVVIIPKCDGIPHEADRIENEEEVSDFFKRMQEEQFDIAFQLHGGGRNSNPFIKKLGAKLTIGLQAEDAPPLDVNIPYFLPQHEVLRYLEVVAQVGAKQDHLEPKVEVTLADQEELEHLIKEEGIPYAVIHPGATDIHRRWPAEKFARVADMLVEGGLKVFLTGTISECTIGEEVVSKMQYSAFNLCGKLSINAMTALLAKAEVVLSNDTGPLHLARAVGARTVGIYWALNLVTAGVITASGNRACTSWNAYCPGCGKNCLHEDIHHTTGTCLHNFSFVEDVSVEEVAETTLKVIALEEEMMSVSA